MGFFTSMLKGAGTSIAREIRRQEALYKEYCELPTESVIRKAQHGNFLDRGVAERVLKERGEPLPSERE